MQSQIENRNNNRRGDQSTHKTPLPPNGIVFIFITIGSQFIKSYYLCVAFRFLCSIKMANQTAVVFFSTVQFDGIDQIQSRMFNLFFHLVIYFCFVFDFFSFAFSVLFVIHTRCSQFIFYFLSTNLFFFCVCTKVFHFSKRIILHANDKIGTDFFPSSSFSSVFLSPVHTLLSLRYAICGCDRCY